MLFLVLINLLLLDFVAFKVYKNFKKLSKVNINITDLDEEFWGED